MNQVRTQRNNGVLGISLSIAIGLTACGGGGDSKTSGTTPSTPAATASAAIGLVSSLTPSGGVIPSGSAIDTAVTYTGAATVGELIAVTANFAQGTYSWTVVQSSYGIAGQTGSGTLTAATTGGGYTMSNGGTLRVTQSGSIFVENLPLTVTSSTVYTGLAAQPPAQQAPTLADIAGTYAWGVFAHAEGAKPPYSGLNDSPEVGWGTASINTSGTGRLCKSTAYSDTCANSSTITVTANDSRCASATNLFGVSIAGDFAGCAVLSSNGSGNVIYLDKQANGDVDPGFLTFVQLPTSQPNQLPNGTYVWKEVIDLAVNADGDCEGPFTVSGTTFNAVCASETVPFPIQSLSPLPSTLLGLTRNNAVTNILLQLAPDAWMTILPTGAMSGTDTEEPGAMHIFTKTGN
jgi:hypothetical protein